LLPAAFGFLYVRAYGVSVVFSDAWSMVRLFEGWSSGTLRLSELWAPHNEHRMLFPKGVELLLGVATGYDNVAEMYVIEACFLLTLVVLLLAFVDGRGPGTARSWLAGGWLLFFLPVSLLTFSLRQYENMLFGFQINFAFTQTFGVLALFLLRTSARGLLAKAAFAGALACATVAAFSTAQGLLVWPAGLLGLLLAPGGPRARPVSAALWGLVGLAEWVVYFIDYSPSGGGSSSLGVLSHPLLAARYFVNLLGSSLFWQEDSAFLGGLFLVALALASLVVSLRLRRSAEDSFWISLLLYSLLMLAAISAGRSGVFGAWQALAPRYTTFSVLAVASVYAILAGAGLGGRRVGSERATVAPLLGLGGAALLGAAVIYSAVVSYQNGVVAGQLTETARERAALVLRSHESRKDRLLTTAFGTRAEVVRRNAPVLERLDLNVFAGPGPRGRD
jgi:hypothetical protein